jgi:hypothetical protein
MAARALRSMAAVDRALRWRRLRQRIIARAGLRSVFNALSQEKTGDFWSLATCSAAGPAKPPRTCIIAIWRSVYGNEEVVAFVQLLPGATVSAEETEVVHGAATRFEQASDGIDRAPSAAPASTGKILKHTLREMANARASTATSSAAAAG